MKYTAQQTLAVAIAALMIAGCGGAEGRKARYLEKGERFYAEQNYEKAGVEFRNALQIDPNDANARYQVGRTAERIGNPREAVGQYQAAIDLDPKYMPARAALGRLYLLSGLADKAMELVETGLSVEPQNASLLTVRGAAKAQLGNTVGAFEDAEAAVAAAPGDEYAIALLASLYRQNARSDKAIEVVRKGLETLPDSADLRVVLADLELSHQQLPQAEAELRKVIELRPNDLNHRYRLARFYLLTKNPDAAEAALREAVTSKPESVEAKMALVDLLASQRGADAAAKQLEKYAAAAPDDAALQMSLARFNESRKKPEEAKKIYLGVIEQHDGKPEALTARNRLAALLLSQSDIDGASKLIDETLKENARDNDALIMRGNLALARGDAAAAIADLRSVLRDQPSSVPVMRALARAHLQNNEMGIAEETLRSAAQAAPSDRDVRLELAQLLSQSGRAEQARPLLEQLASETSADIGTLEALFRVQAAQKDLSAARTTAQSIARLRPDLPLGSYLEGAVDEAEKKVDAAAQAYEKALSIQADAGEPLTGLVRIDIQRGKPEQALARLNQTVAANPDNVIALNLKGEVLMGSKQVEPAIAAFNQAIEKAPRWWMPYRGLALAQLSAKRQDAAVEALERGLKNASEVSALGSDLAALYERTGQPEDAIRTYEVLVKREPASVSATNNLAMLLVSYRSDKESLDRAQQLTARLGNVTAPSVLNTRGWVKFKRGEFQASLPLLRQAVEQVPDSAVMRYHLGMAQWRTGDRNAARENLEAAVKSGSPFLGAQEAKSALEEIARAG